jgi:hypothetical protein
VDGWLAEQPSLVHSKRRSLLPVLRERQALAGQLVDILMKLGLERRARPVPSLQQYLASRAETVTAAPPGDAPDAEPRRERRATGAPGSAPPATEKQSAPRSAATGSTAADGAEGEQPCADASQTLREPPGSAADADSNKDYWEGAGGAQEGSLALQSAPIDPESAPARWSVAHWNREGGDQ